MRTHATLPLGTWTVPRLQARATVLLLVVTLITGMAPYAHADLAAYTQDFEGLVQSDPSALGSNGWVVFGNVFAPDGTTYLYGYGPYPAPNDGFAFCQIDLGQGGVEQGFQQLVVFSDYNNADHAAGRIIESNVYREQTIGAANVGQTWTFEFQAKLGNLAGSTTAAAWIKTLNPSAGWVTTNWISQNTTSIPATWSGYSLSIVIDATLVGQILQIGFSNRATNYVGAGVFYDNLNFHEGGGTASPPLSVAFGAMLGQNYPNPFNPSTKIDFRLDQSGAVDLAVFDLAGHRVATLAQGDLPGGDHAVIWSGRADDGAAVASGRYTYVLATAAGRISRGMVLLK